MASRHPVAPRRREVLEAVADRVAALDRSGVRRVGVDGVDGAGKTVFADELADVLRKRDTDVVRVSEDGFHRPRADRYRRGRDSPEGFYRDSYDDERLLAELLGPLGPGGDGRFRRAVLDHRSDTRVDVPVETATPGDVLVVDGLFLHRPALRGCWDVSVLLDVPFVVSVARCAARDRGSPDPAAATNRRYVEGQRLYLAECEPRRRATVVVDNTDLSNPCLEPPSGRRLAP